MANHNTPVHLAQLVRPMLAKHQNQQLRQPQTPLTLLNASFPVSCHKNTLGGKSFEGVGEIEGNATQQLLQMHRAGYRRCFEQKSPWNKLIQAEEFRFRRDQYVLVVTTVLLVRQRQSGCFLIRPRGGTSGSLTLHTEGLCSPH